MARTKEIEKSTVPYNVKDSKALEDKPERFKLSEAGYHGLNIFDGISKDELKRELSWPHAIKTFKQMSYHSAITAPLTLFENIIGKSDFKFVPPENATEEELNQTRIMNEMLHDMDQPFSEVIRDALSMNVYGFSIHEKIFRKRYKSSGSKYDDGIIAWKKLPIRNQETIEKFIFSDDGNEILGVKQNLQMISDTYNRYVSRVDKEVVLPKAKYLHFRSGRHKGDPFGKSMLRDAYLAWRYLTALEEIEANGVARDLNGMPVLYLPAQYMAPDASPEMKSVYEYYKNVVRNIQMNQQSGLILPSATDPETRHPLFKFELVSTDGKKNFDTTKVKEYYKNLIFTSLSADILIMGQNNTGSFALAEAKNSLTGSSAEAMLRSIVEVLNTDLVRHTYELNGWDTSRMAVLDFDGLETDSLDEIGKFYQRLGATGFLPKTLAVVNHALEVAGIDKLPSDTTQEELDEMLPDKTTRSGDGMQEGLNSGTGSASGSSGNASDTNADNAS